MVVTDHRNEPYSFQSVIYSNFPPVACQKQQL